MRPLGQLLRRALPLLALAALSADGCGDADTGGAPPPVGDVQVKMDFRRADGFFDAPFPSAELQREDGRADVSGFPNRDDLFTIRQALALLAADNNGFAVTAGAFFSLTGAVDPRWLPDVYSSRAPGASVFLLSLADGKQAPVRVAFQEDGGPFGATNLLSLVPYQGVALQPRTRYAAVVCDTLLDRAGRRLRVSPVVEALANGRVPSGFSALQGRDYLDGYRAASARCSVAGVAVFTTGDPVEAMARFRRHALGLAPPAPTVFTAKEVFDEFCVFAATIDMPDYQQGRPPYSRGGGTWAVDDAGEPMRARYATANLVVTVPRAPMPAAGYPTVVFVRAGGGGERPLVDRGVQGRTGGPALVPGSGPAREFARAGWAGIQVDGPLGGLRNVTRGDEQTLVFNVTNLGALRDNVRESALELQVLARVLDDLEVDASGCPGAASRARFAAAERALMGHSTGATIAPLAMAFEPSFRAAVLSGAGGSYIENILYKRKPLPLLPAALLLLGYTDRELTEHDPAINLVQWALEPADPPAYAGFVIRDPVYRGVPAHVLMLQGIVDNYILPNIANATTLSLGLDLAGPDLDDPSLPGLAGQTPVAAVLPFAGRRSIAFPVACNRAAGAACVTAVVSQHAEDGVEDGHEVVFQTEPPKRQYRCFLRTLLHGVPRVPAGDAADSACGN